MKLLIGSTMDEKRRFLKKIGQSSEGYSITPRSEALYNIKLSMRYGDQEALKKYLLEYFAKGGTVKGFEQSLNTMNPLYGLNETEKLVFCRMARHRRQRGLLKSTRILRQSNKRRNQLIIHSGHTCFLGRGDHHMAGRGRRLPNCI